MPVRRFSTRPLREISGASSTKSAGNSVCTWHKLTLGDKIHELARLSPKHVVALELLVDQILKKVR